MKMIKTMLLVSSLTGLFAITGCEKGPMEKTGEKIDNAAEKTVDAAKEAKDEVKDAVK